MPAQPAKSQESVCVYAKPRKAATKESGDMAAPVVVYIRGEVHTLASALRPELERANPNDFVSVTQPHPMDDFTEVYAPTRAAVRDALLAVRGHIATARNCASAACSTGRK